VGKAAGAAAAFATVTLVLAKLAEADYMSKIDTGMGKVSLALADIATNAPGAATSMDQLFKDRDGGDLISSVTDLDSALKRTFKKDGGQAFNDGMESFFNTLTGIQGSSQILEGSFSRLDAGLADLVSGGSADDAAKSFEQIKKAAEDQGVSVEDLVTKFPQYADALKAAEAASKTAAAEGKNVDGSLTDAGKAAEAAAVQVEEVEKALEEVGLSADAAVTDIGKFTAVLFSAGLLSLSASDASIAYQAAIDGLTDSIVTNGTSLDINTEQGRANRSAFNGIASAAMAAMTATAEETLATQGSAAAQAQLQSSLRTSYDDLIAAADQLGIVGDEADTMARKALGIPKEIPIDTWVNDKATSTLEGIKGKADALDGRVVRTKIETLIETINKTVHQSEYRDDPSMVALTPGGATGGRVADIMGFAGGGKVPGRAPSNLAMDNILATVNGKPLAVQSEEWIINGRSSKEYDRELAAINAGTFPKMPGYANGARVSREYSAPSLARPAPAAGGSGDVTVFVTNPFTGEQVQAVVAKVARGEMGNASTRSTYQRGGHK
jgi:hypothetical protein